jgi:hypothetical protein
VQIQPGVSSPIFFRREAETTVTVKDNETVVLGGLIRTRESVTDNKVPILGDIPVAGALFRAEQVDTERTELLLVLTPRIVRSVEDYRELSVRERDNSSVLSDEVLTNPLMQGLRVDPEQLAPPGDILLGPFPSAGDRRGSDGKVDTIRELVTPPPGVPAPRSAPQPGDMTPAGQDAYGPVPAGRSKPARPRGDPNSYDVPITKAVRPKAAAP